MPRHAKYRPSATRSERRQAALRRRREELAAREAAARRAVRRRRLRRVTAVVGTIGAVAVVVVGAIVLWPEAQPSRRLVAAVVPEASGRLGVTQPPVTYHATYRVVTYAKGKSAVATQEIYVRRPFDGRLVIRDGEPPGAGVKFDSRSTYTQYANYANPTSPQLASEPPNVAVGDLRLDATLDDLVSSGMFQQRERRRLLDRDCQVYRTGLPLERLSVKGPTPKDYADACVDQAGLVLEEVAVTGGKVSQHVTAIDVKLDQPIVDEEFTIAGTPVGFDQGGAQLAEITPAAPPVVGYWQLGAVPEGFSHKGRYRLTTADTRSETGQTVDSWVDTYVNGTALLLVQQGPNAAHPTVDPNDGTPADLGPLGSGRLVLGEATSSLLSHPTQDSFVEVSGSVPVATLRQVAAGLAPAPATPAP